MTLLRTLCFSLMRLWYLFIFTFLPTSPTTITIVTYLTAVASPFSLLCYSVLLLISWNFFYSLFSISIKEFSGNTFAIKHMPLCPSNQYSMINQMSQHRETTKRSIRIWREVWLNPKHHWSQIHSLRRLTMMRENSVWVKIIVRIEYRKGLRFLHPVIFLMMT